MKAQESQGGKMAALVTTWQTSSVNPSKADYPPAVFDSSGSSNSECCVPTLFLRVQQSSVREMISG